MNTFRAEAVWLPGRVERDRTIEVSASGEIMSIREGNHGDGEPLRGLVLPGLINAHVHLELSWMKGAVPSTKRGLVEWVVRQLHARAGAPTQEEQQAVAQEYAEQMFGHGTAGVFDISNGNQTAKTLAEAGLSGIVQHELLTMDRRRVPSQLKEVVREARTEVSERATIRLRPGPHALYSTAPQLIVESACAQPDLPFSIHVAESPEEDDFLVGGHGPLAAFLDDLGVDWRWWEPVGLSPVGYLDALQLLDERSLLVHGVCLTELDLRRIASRGASLCLCPRSNRWISGRLPDVELAHAVGCRLCVGTDSVASNDDLDLFGELAALGQSFPAIGMDVWMKAATENGADVLGLGDLGRIEVGRAPGLLHLPETVTLDALRLGPPKQRRWLVSPGRTRV